MLIKAIIFDKICEILPNSMVGFCYKVHLSKSRLFDNQQTRRNNMKSTKSMRNRLISLFLSLVMIAGVFVLPESGFVMRTEAFSLNNWAWPILYPGSINPGIGLRNITNLSRCRCNPRAESEAICRNGNRCQEFHNGIDISPSRSGVIGDVIVAAKAGKVESITPIDGMGRTIQIRHNDGSLTVYGHLNHIGVDKDQNVIQGQQIGTMGKSGTVDSSTGTIFENSTVHLHFEIWSIGDRVSIHDIWRNSNNIQPDNLVNPAPSTNSNAARAGDRINNGVVYTVLREVVNPNNTTIISGVQSRIIEHPHNINISNIEYSYNQSGSNISTSFTFDINSLVLPAALRRPDGRVGLDGIGWVFVDNQMINISYGNMYGWGDTSFPSTFRTGMIFDGLTINGNEIRYNGRRVEYFRLDIGAQHHLGLANGYHRMYSFVISRNQLKLPNEIGFANAIRVPNDAHSRIIIKCPVDVEIYNLWGELVGRVSDNIVDNSIFNSVDITLSGAGNDTKEIILPMEEEFIIKLIGTDDGVLNYTVSDIDADTGEVIREHEFVNIELFAGKEIISNIPAHGVFDYEDVGLFHLDGTDTFAIQPDGSKHAVDKVNVLLTSDVGGFVFGSGIYDKNNIVEISAEANWGYEFIGWYDDDILISTDAEYSFTATSNIQLEARFEKLEFTVTFETFDGSNIEPKTIEFLSLLSEFEPPTKSGYTFAGWFMDDEYEEEWELEFFSVTHDMTLYAKWIENNTSTLCAHCNNDPCNSSNQSCAGYVSPTLCAHCNNDPCNSSNQSCAGYVSPPTCTGNLATCQVLNCTACATGNNNGGTTTPPTGGDTTIPPNNNDTTTPSSGGDTTIPPNNNDTTTPPTGGDTTTSPNNNGTTTPPNNDTTTPPVTEHTPEDYIDDSFIAEILKQDNPVLDLSQLDSTILSAEDLQMIKASGKDVTVILENGFLFIIKANSIQSWAKDFDLNIVVELTSRATEIDGVKIPANAIIINPNFNGEFGFEIAFTFTSEQLAAAGINGNNVKLFHIDYDGNVTDMGRARLNADGLVEIVISHASFYVLSEEALTSADESDTTTTTPPASTEDGNPTTGVALSMTAVILAGRALGVSRKQKNRNDIIKN
jgi:uncharacterized repeat protein (TIGR02543 family)